MNTAPTGKQTVLGTAALLLGNLTVLMIAAMMVSARADRDGIYSTTPETDGAITAIGIVVAMAFLNGGILSFWPPTRRVGGGILIGAIASVPIALIVGLLGYSTAFVG